MSFLLFRLVMLFLWRFTGFLGPLGELWGLLWEALGGHLGPLGVVLGKIYLEACLGIRENVFGGFGGLDLRASRVDWRASWGRPGPF